MDTSPHPRNHGFEKLGDLVTKLALFEVEKRGAEGKPKAIDLREKRTRDSKPKSS